MGLRAARSSSSHCGTELRGTQTLNPSAAPSRRSRLGRTLALAGVLVITHLSFLNDYPRSPNPNVLSRVFLTLAIAQHGRLTVDDCVRRFGPTQDLAAYGGHYYSDKPPGYSVLLAPIAWTALRLGVAWDDLPRMTAILRVFGLSLPMVLFWLLTRMAWAGWAGDEQRGDAVMLAGALGTNVFIYATQLFSHAMAAMLLFAAYLAIREGRRPWIVGLLLAVAFTIDYLVVIAAGLLAAWFIARGPRRRAVVAAGLFVGSAIPLGLWMAYNWHCFGSLFSVGFHYHIHERFRAGYQSGLLGMHAPPPEAWLGMWFSARRGLLFFSPLLALAPLGWRKMWRQPQSRSDAIGAAAAALGVWLFALTTLDWTGGWSVSMRYLVPAVPFLLVGVAAVLHDAGSNRWLGVAFSATVAVGFVHAAVTAATFPWFPSEFSRPLAQLAFPLLRDDVINAALLLPSAPGAVGIVYLVAMLGAVVFVVPVAAQQWRRVTLAVVLAAGFVLVEVATGDAGSPENRLHRAGVERRMGLVCDADTLEAAVLGDRLAGQPTDFQAVGKLARLLATSACPGVRDGARAVQLVERMLAEPRFRSAATYEVAANAFAEAGRFADAVAAAREAIARAGDSSPGRQLRDRVSERLKLYEAGRPYHESP